LEEVIRHAMKDLKADEGMYESKAPRQGFLKIIQKVWGCDEELILTMIKKVGVEGNLDLVVVNGLLAIVLEASDLLRS